MTVPSLTSPDLSLMKIEAEAAELMRLYEDAERDGALPDELEVIQQQIREYAQRRLDKADGIAYVRRVFQMAIDEARAESKRMAERARMFERRLERLDNATLHAIKASGKPKIETPLNTLTPHKCPASLLVTDPAAVPIQFKQVTVTMSAGEWRNFCDILPEEYLLQHLLPFVIKEEYHINNAALKAALQKGQTIPGAELVTDKVTLVVS